MMSTPNNKPIILQVDEEDASHTYYRLKSADIALLNTINGKKFMFIYVSGKSFSLPYSGFHKDIKYINPIPGIVETNDLEHVGPEVTDPVIINFLGKFRHGKDTTNWDDIAEIIQIINYNDNIACCPASNYSIFLTH